MVVIHHVRKLDQFLYKVIRSSISSLLMIVTKHVLYNVVG